MDNNDAEHHNAIVAKFTGGKIINLAKDVSILLRVKVLMYLSTVRVDD